MLRLEDLASKRWRNPLGHASHPARGDHPQPDGRSHTTSILTFSLTTHTQESEEAVTGVAPDDALRTPRAGRAVPDTGDPRDEAQTGAEPVGDIDDGPIKIQERWPPARPVTRTMT